MDISQIPVSAIRGVTSRQVAALRKTGVLTVMDLLLRFPVSYLDRTRLTPMGELAPDRVASVRGIIVSRRQGRNSQLYLTLADDTGRLNVTMFNCPVFMSRELAPGAVVTCHGRVGVFQNALQMANPELDFKNSPPPAGYTPNYRLTRGISMQSMRNLVAKALDLAAAADACAELVPAELNETGLTLAEALRKVHAPDLDTPLDELARCEAPAQQRVIREELIAQQLSVLTLKEQNRRLNGIPLPPAPDLTAKLIASLPFEPTGAQLRVFGEISRDMSGARPMSRLVQGDVGCGKTLVAVLAALQAAAAGFQTAIMAPTGILAEQHYAGVKDLLAPLGVGAALLTGGQKAAEKKRQLKLIADGEALIAVGTHAIFQEAVAFANLGLVVIDEQHRFGVEQRMRLRDKRAAGGRMPHILAMTATPIPRTLAQTIYADMSVSVIDEMPRGRIPVTTYRLDESYRDKTIDQIGARCAEPGGKQVYWICPLVSESDFMESQDAVNARDYIARRLPRLKVGLMHGQMKAAEKDEVMRAFRNGEIQVLVATSVIEVGVDVPNAYLIVIENAERYGLAQLHQLRGRVGRGSIPSFCELLHSKNISPVGAERLDTLCRSTDGFVIAQKDLELRGPGDLLGTRQTGAVSYRVADPVRDFPCLDRCAAAAGEIYASRPELRDRLIRRWFPDCGDAGAM